MSEKKRGRPRKEVVKEKRITVRIRGDDVDKFNFLFIEKDMSPTEMFKKGLNMLYNISKFG